MASIGKLIRLFMTLGMGLTIFLTLQWLSGAPPTGINASAFPKFSNLPSYEDAKKHLQDAKSSLQGAFSSKPKGQSESQSESLATRPTSNHALGPGTGLPSGYVEDAHKLQDADAFTAHFKAVTRIPGISMKTAKADCNWSSDQKVNFQYSDNEEWAKKDRTDGELDLHRREWHKFILNDLIPYRDHAQKWSGQGIVIVAGGVKGREQIKVILRALKKLGSTLPVEVHFWENEINLTDQQDILSVSPTVHFNNLKESSSQNIVKTDHNPFIHNYQFKTAGVINSRFAEVLLLDSDNIPVIAPESLFDSGVYKEYGTVFWPDIARTRPNNPIWGITNTKCRKDEFEQESGQMLVNKNKFFYHLQLSAWLNTAKQGEYYNKFLLGDKDMFRFAWHALKTPYGRPSKWIKTIGMVHGDTYCGHSFGQHHPDFWNGSVAFVHAGLTKLMPKDFLVWQRTNGGIFQAYQATDKDEDTKNLQPVGLKIDRLEYWSNKPATIEQVQCNEMYELKSKPLDEVVSKYNSFFEEIGGYTLLENYFGGKEP